MSFKSIIGFGLLAKAESTYNDGTTLSDAEDGVLCADNPEATIEYAFDGARATPPGTAGALQNVAPNGRSATGTCQVEGRGAGTAYTDSTIVPPGLHTLIQASGFTAELDNGTWTYTPRAIDEDPVSAALRLYSRGERWDIGGVYCDMSIGTEDASPPVFEFSFSGLPSDPVDASVPTIVYGNTIPPKTEAIQFTMGGVGNLKVRSFSLELGREIAPRLDLNAQGGHAGFATGRRQPSFSVSVEAEPLATLDPYELQKEATPQAFSLTVGSTVGNTYTISGNAVVSGVEDTEDGPVSIWDITLSPVVTDGSANNDLMIEFS